MHGNVRVRKREVYLTFDGGSRGVGGGVSSAR